MNNQKDYKQLSKIYSRIGTTSAMLAILAIPSIPVWGNLICRRGSQDICDFSSGFQLFFLAVIFLIVFGIIGIAGIATGIIFRNLAKKQPQSIQATSQKVEYKNQHPIVSNVSLIIGYFILILALFVIPVVCLISLFLPSTNGLGYALANVFKAILDGSGIIIGFAVTGLAFVVYGLLAKRFK